MIITFNNSDRWNAITLNESSSNDYEYADSGLQQFMKPGNRINQNLITSRNYNTHTIYRNVLAELASYKPSTFEGKL